MPSDNHQRAIVARRNEPSEAARRHSGMLNGLRIVIDLTFMDASGDERERQSLARQVLRVYRSIAYNKHAVSLHLMCIGEETERALRRQCANESLCFDHLIYYRIESIEQIPRRRPTDSLVYLSPDAVLPLQSVSAANCVYVLGGRVDKSTHRPFSLWRANELGVSARRLPIGEHMERIEDGRAHFEYSQTVEICEAFEILANVARGCDWRTALGSTVPSTKSGYRLLPDAIETCVRELMSTMLDRVESGDVHQEASSTVRSPASEPDNRAMQSGLAGDQPVVAQFPARIVGTSPPAKRMRIAEPKPAVSAREPLLATPQAAGRISVATPNRLPARKSSAKRTRFRAAQRKSFRRSAPAANRYNPYPPSAERVDYQRAADYRSRQRRSLSTIDHHAHLAAPPYYNRCASPMDMSGAYRRTTPILQQHHFRPLGGPTGHMASPGVHHYWDNNSPHYSHDRFRPLSPMHQRGDFASQYSNRSYYSPQPNRPLLATPPSSHRSSEWPMSRNVLRNSDDRTWRQSPTNMQQYASPYSHRRYELPHRFEPPPAPPYFPPLCDAIPAVMERQNLQFDYSLDSIRAALNLATHI